MGAALKVAVLTVSDTRTQETDTSGAFLEEALRDAGHETHYWEYVGQSHALLDSGSNILTGSNFAEAAPPALDVMIDFVDRVFREVGN